MKVSFCFISVFFQVAYFYSFWPLISTLEAFPRCLASLLPVCFIIFLFQRPFLGCSDPQELALSKFSLDHTCLASLLLICQNIGVGVGELALFPFNMSMFCKLPSFIVVFPSSTVNFSQTRDSVLSFFSVLLGAKAGYLLGSWE